MTEGLKNLFNRFLYRENTANFLLLTSALPYFSGAIYVIYNLIENARFGADDANIIFVYAQNMASGNGIVYNAGGEHVEGFTGFLYFLVCSFCFLISKAPEILLLMINAALAFFSFALLFSGIHHLNKNSSAGQFTLLVSFGVLGIWFLMNPLYFGWMVVSLLDGGIYGFMITALFVFLIIHALKPASSHKDTLLCCLLVFLMILCRPEGLVWGILTVFGFFVSEFNRSHSGIHSAKKTLPVLTAYLTAVTALTVFRKLYFGYPLPNTYYAKVSASQTAVWADGIQYLSSFSDFYGYTLFVPLFLLSVWLLFQFFAGKSSPLFTVALITIAFVSAGFLIPVLEGGEHFHGFRFYQSSYPLMIFPWLVLLHIADSQKLGLWTFAASALFLSAVFLERDADWKNFSSNNQKTHPITDLRGSISMEFDIAAGSGQNSRRIAAFFKEKLPSIGYGSAGGIKLNYPGVVYDMMGLNNSRMAHADALKTGPKGHQSFSKKVFFELNPDVLMPMVTEGDPLYLLTGARDYYTNPVSWDNQIFKNLFNDSVFKEKYVLASLGRKENPSIQCYGFYNRTYLNNLSQGNTFDIHTINPY